MKGRLAAWVLCILISRVAPAPAADEKLHQQLVGTWEVNITADDDLVIRQMWHLDEMGRLKLMTVAGRSDRRSISFAAGKWELNGRVVVFTIESSDNSKLERGHQEKNEVLSISESEVLTRGEDGTIIRAVRRRK
jgi:hypothetical protein